MSNRKSGYVIRLVVAWIFASLPWFAILACWGWESRRTGYPFEFYLLSPCGGASYVVRTFGHREQYRSTLDGNAFWHDKYVTGQASVFKNPDGTSFALELLDPESGDTTGNPAQSIWGDKRQAVVVGDRLLLLGSSDIYVFAHGELKLDPNSMWRGWGTRVAQDTLFIWDDHVAEITPKWPVTKTTRGFDLYTFEAAKRRWISGVVLPARSGETRLSISDGGPGEIKCVNRGDHPHFFLKQDGHYYYRNGLDQKVLPDAEISASGSTLPEDPPQEDSDGLAGWSLIRIATKNDQKDQFLGMFVAGRPAIAVIEGLDSTEPIARFYRFDGANWLQFAVQKLPLGSLTFQVDTVADAERAYLAVSTSMGFTHVYAIEDSGVRETRFSENANHWSTTNLPFVMKAVIHGLASGAMIFIFNLFTVIVFGLGVWWVMSRYTTSTYESGLETVQLASIGWRGLARLIDLTLIVVATGVCVWQVAKAIDWLTLLECLNLQIDAPEIAKAKRLSMFIPAVPLGIALMMIVTQGRWGITPGKWLCRLRTVRSTLRRCGLPASVAREAILLLDCGNFFFWTPGILSIALTQHRQRLGDLLGDTIVINARSKKAP